MIFTLSTEFLTEHDALATAQEIAQQPLTWYKTKTQFDENLERYRRIVDKYLSDPSATIVFSGAGSSEFIGNALVSNIKTISKATIASIATTDILTDVSGCLKKESPTLMVSFGRSGSSPESVGAFLEVQNYCDQIEHIFITCNHQGKLAELAKSNSNVTSIELTPETHDVGFAMTSSFSNMYLMAALLFVPGLDEMDLDEVYQAAKNFLSYLYTPIKKMVEDYDFQRIVYLGSGPLKAIAQESALKILELTQGEIPSLFDTFLGFRHGPKSFLDHETLTVMYLSNQPHTRQYEIDLLKEMSIETHNGKILVIDTLVDDEVASLANEVIIYQNMNTMPMALVVLPYLMVGQTLGLLKSLHMGKTPDNPDPTGSVNRVVKGVTLYVKGETL